MLFPEIELRAPVITVSELNRGARQAIEQALPLMWIAGEISNCTRAASGHFYFALKDESAQVRCVMFRQKMQWLNFEPQDGTQVEVRAAPTLFEARGEFQLNIEIMRRSGLGALFEKFDQVKRKLAVEGLFEAARKKPLPVFPKTIGIVTSRAAAALHDVLSALARRAPMISVILYPTPVQGEAAPARIAAAIKAADRRGECDVLIVCRGGGSIEDLWAFNDETVARAIADCRIPVVSGVGHETDFTIADYVADVRAPSPTAAAELSSPHRGELLARLGKLHGCLDREMARALSARAQQLDYCARRLTHPARYALNQLAHVRHLHSRLCAANARAIESRRWRLQELLLRLGARRPNLEDRKRRLTELSRGLQRGVEQCLQRGAHAIARAQVQIAHLNPQAVLERGFTITQDSRGAIIRDSAAIAPHERLRITFAAGWAETEVIARGEPAVRSGEGGDV
ncbi:MAG: exodeoxyribonuclease VII large subunit [Burkholderiales bacterium]|nr:exodeoxyribonuclease VII large subunit [Burkholderiales bacterium]